MLSSRLGALLLLAAVGSALLPTGRCIAFSRVGSLRHEIATIKQQQKRGVLVLHSSPYEEQRSGLSLKVLGVLALAVVGVFGTGFVTSFQGFAKDAALEAQRGGKGSLKGDGSTASRGALTKLTRREINTKLAAVPIFFASKDDGKTILVDTKTRTAKLFASKEDCDRYSLSEGAKTAATSLDDCYYTLIERKTKIGVTDGVASTADPEASYVLVGSSENVAAAEGNWKETHMDDIPLFRVQNLAFSKDSGLEIPLFLSKQDAIANYNRLQDEKLKVSKGDSAPDDKSSAEPVIQITSIRDVVKLWGTGGIEGRALELYPEIKDIDNARTLMK